MHNFLPTFKNSENNSKAEQDVESLPSSATATVNMRIDELSIENLSVFHDHYNYTMTDEVLNSMHDEIHDFPVDPMVDCKLVSDDYDYNSEWCRLCITKFPRYHLQSDPNLFGKCDVIGLQIKRDDSLSQLACTSCLERLNKCIETIHFFRQAQYELRNRL